MPPYARGTGLQVVRRALKAAELTDTEDEALQRAAARTGINQYEALLQEERSHADPERFSTTSSNRLPRGPPKRMDSAQVELPKVSVREIQVKQVDRNIAHLRANQDPSAGSRVSRMGSGASLPAGGGGDQGGVGGGAGSGAGGGIGPSGTSGGGGRGGTLEGAVAVMNACILRRISEVELGGDPKREVADNFASALM
ncbi:unnamed protein product, partial [Discosporangium mesarthrocarpum]